MTPATGDTREADSNSRSGVPRWLVPLRSRIVGRHGGLMIWRGFIAVLGFLVVAGGIVLLPLPGPGWAIIFGGVAIWATEFAWAQRLLIWAREVLAGWTRWLLARPLPLRLLIGAVGLTLLAALFYLLWIWLYR